MPAIQTNDIAWTRGSTTPLAMTLGAGFDDVRIRVFSTSGAQGAVGNGLAFTATLEDETMEVTDAPSGTVAFTPTSDQTNLLTPNDNGKPRNIYTVETKIGEVWTKRIEGMIYAHGGPIPVSSQARLHNGVSDFYADHPEID